MSKVAQPCEFAIDVNLIVLNRPVSTDEFKHHIIERFNNQCDPKLFTVDGNATQNYMVAIPESVASIVLSSIEDDNLCLLMHPSKSSSNTARRKRKATKGGVRSARSNARIGQGAFRDEVLEIWDNTCPVTKVALPELLIASHIVSWVLSDDDEKIDGYNGFPFTPNVDKLFDKGLISFSDDGLLLISPHLSVATLNALGIREDTKIAGLTEEHIFYLEKHRKTFGF